MWRGCPDSGSRGADDAREGHSLAGEVALRLEDEEGGRVVALGVHLEEPAMSAGAAGRTRASESGTNSVGTAGVRVRREADVVDGEVGDGEVGHDAKEKGGWRRRGRRMCWLGVKTQDDSLSREG